MRLLPILLVALMIAPLAVSQPGMDQRSEHQVRIAYGDIPATTDIAESAGQWNVEQRLTLDDGSNGTLTLPAGHSLGTISCQDNCTADATVDGNEVRIVCQADETDGTCTVTVPHSVQGPLDAFGMSIPVLDDHTVFVYTPVGLEVTSGTANMVPAPQDEFFYPGTDRLIHQYQSDGGRFWFTISPQAVTTDAPAAPIGWLGVVIGAVAGAAVWYVLVRQGIVQKRQRRQVAGAAAHQEAAKEGKETLEWRRRALLAALKSLEVARMDQEIDLDAYDNLKADFKRQTVTVMRALEELGD